MQFKNTSQSTIVIPQKVELEKKIEQLGSTLANYETQVQEVVDLSLKIEELQQFLSRAKKNVADKSHEAQMLDSAHHEMKVSIEDKKRFIETLHTQIQGLEDKKKTFEDAATHQMEALNALRKDESGIVKNIELLELTNKAKQLEYTKINRGISEGTLKLKKLEDKMGTFSHISVDLEKTTQELEIKKSVLAQMLEDIHSAETKLQQTEKTTDSLLGQVQIEREKMEKELRAISLENDKILDEREGELTKREKLLENKIRQVQNFVREAEKHFNKPFKNLVI